MRQTSDIALAEVKHSVWAAQRQLHRFQTAYLQEYGSAAAGTTIAGSERINSNTSSDVHLLCLVTYKVAEAQDRVKKSVTLPWLDERTARVARLLRDVHAQWEINRAVPYVPAPPKLRALPKEARAFMRAFPNRNPFSVKLEAGSLVIADLLDLNDLSSRLFELERALTGTER